MQTVSAILVDDDEKPEKEQGKNFPELTNLFHQVANTTVQSKAHSATIVNQGTITVPQLIIIVEDNIAKLIEEQVSKRMTDFLTLMKAELKGNVQGSGEEGESAQKNKSNVGSLRN